MSWNTDSLVNYHSFANSFKGSDLTVYIEIKVINFFGILYLVKLVKI